jgi:biotin operon repressor
MSRYYASDTIDTIARDLSLSRSMINKELAAIRAALKEKLESEGYSI